MSRHLKFGKNLLYSLRPKQWVKNFFIFLPLIFGQQLFNVSFLLSTVTAFILFSLSAGTVYLMNDILDLDYDKHHTTKKLKPIASGKISVKEAGLAAAVLGTAVVFSSFFFNRSFGFIVAAYFFTNFIYSHYLKKLIIIDVFCIGLFFWLRLVAGGVVTGIDLSHWIVMMTILLALFLGFIKRRQELRLLGRSAASHRSVLSHYNQYFIDQMISVITSSIVVAYLLYTVDARTVQQVGSRGLMLSIPFVYYGIFRYLYLMHRLSKEGDPTRILLKDRMLQINITLWILVCIGVIYFPLT